MIVHFNFLVISYNLLISLIGFKTHRAKTETNMNWLPAIFGIWQDKDNAFTGYLPDVDDSVFHYGPTRIWSKPVQRGRYGK